ncbi:MAG TPA: hypothetical protein DHM90_06095 [Clostridiaceae bacterium]|nr:hypothetical protein [Clostridiaceae bacterium]
MKVNGTEEIIKLLLEVKVGEGGIKNPDRTENLEKTLKNVDEMIRKDEFMQSGKVNNVKTEIQFTKNLYESPEAYLHRISKEVINVRENERINLDDSVLHYNLNNNEIGDTITRSGLLKDVLSPINEKSNKTLGDIHNKWLSKVIVIFLLVLFIYFLFIQ